MLLFQIGTGGMGLGHSQSIQRYVLMPLQSALGIPWRFTMAHNTATH
jgi:hypothetical protein